MITVTRINGQPVTINALLIELVEGAADTVITLTTGNKIVVKESTADIVELSQQYLRAIGLVATSQKSQMKKEH
jgi:flagellar protein FlbD